jgi:hypothetical protein
VCRYVSQLAIARRKEPSLVLTHFPISLLQPRTIERKIIYFVCFLSRYAPAMVFDPVEPFAAATYSRMASVPAALLPTLVPLPPEYEVATDTGNRTLWYVV